MVTNYFTLVALSRELRLLISGSTIRQIFTQKKNELIISGGRVPTGTASDWWLHTSIDPGLNYIFVDAQGARAKRNSVDLFDALVGSTIEAVSVHPFDRTLMISLRTGQIVFIQLYDTAASNIYLTDENRVILDAFKKRKKLMDSPLPAGEKRFDASILDDPLRFRESLGEHSSKTAFSALKASVPFLGSTFAREACHRAGVNENTAAADIGEEDTGHLLEEVLRILNATGSAGAEIYFRGDEPKVLSVIPLKHLSAARIERFPTVNEAVMRLIRKASRSRTFEAQKNGLLKAIRMELERSRRSFEMARTHAAGASAAAGFEKVGKLILGNLQRIEKGTSRIDLSDLSSGGKPVPVSLNPALSPARNAEEYFRKAKKARLSLQDSDSRAEMLRSKISALETMLLHLDNCQTPEQLAEFRNEHATVLRTIRGGEENPREERLPFRVFEVAGGFQVLVGKSSANNDLLTSKYARPNDLWFHARGASGSHAVLKVSRGRPIPREAIRDAASIAAYYSKMRNASTVPVAYCERKYVRKPKGAPPGTVMLEREEVIFVQPRLP